LLRDLLPDDCEEERNVLVCNPLAGFWSQIPLIFLFSFVAAFRIEFSRAGSNQSVPHSAIGDDLVCWIIRRYVFACVRRVIGKRSHMLVVETVSRNDWSSYRGVFRSYQLFCNSFGSSSSTNCLDLLVQPRFYRWSRTSICYFAPS